MSEQDQQVNQEEPPQLSDEDMARVESYLHSGFNTTERKPFRPLKLLFILAIIVFGIGGFSQLIAKWSGIF